MVKVRKYRNIEFKQSLLVLYIKDLMSVQIISYC